MKNLKKALAIVLSLSLVLAMAVPSFAAPEDTGSASGISVFKINPYGNEEDAIDTIAWYEISGKYFLFLPADCNLSDAVFYYDSSDPVTVGPGGSALADGGHCDAIGDAGTYTLTSGGKTYTLVVMKSQNVPAVFIATESGSLDYIHANKENKEAADIRVYENGEKSLDEKLKHIKGRGNFTWSLPQKPYNIKFDSKKKMLGMTKAKKWTMLASWSDISMIRNPLTWYYSDKFGLPFTPDYKVVDLYINGEYKGNYTICESVEVGSSRVNINDLDDANEEANPGVDIESLKRNGTKILGVSDYLGVRNTMKWVEIPNDPEDISGGYLLEYDLFDRYQEEVSGFITYNGQSVTLKSPEYATKNEVKYIRDFVNEATEALYSATGYNSKGRYYTEYFDMDSLVNMYIIEELSENMDAALTSFFMYKPENSDKLIVCPVWDMEKAYQKQSRFTSSSTSGEGWWVNSINSYRGFYSVLEGIKIVNTIPLLFNAAYKHEDYRAMVTERWNEIKDADLIQKGLNKVNALKEELEASTVMNLVRWNICGSTDTTVCSNRYRSEIESVVNFVNARKPLLDKGFAEDGAMLYYDANGGYGWLYNKTVSSIGDSLTVLGTKSGNTYIVSPSAGKAFRSWNTKPDGTGKTYKPGDTIVLEQKTTTLYAQWSKWSNKNFRNTKRQILCKLISSLKGKKLIAGNIFEQLWKL